MFQTWCMETRPFGNTGHPSSRVIFGGFALVGLSREEADRVLKTLLQHGVNHLDVAAAYGDGQAETRMGEWMPEHRGRFFLATKTGERSAAGARRDLEASLKRLQTDSVDLIQLHNLTVPAEWEQALSPGGALKALIEAREQGLARYIGVTGHGTTAPEMHLRSLERFDFDSVLLPCNYVMMRDPAYARAFARLQRRCRQKKIAVQAIKAVARRPWPQTPDRTTWYQPLEDPEAVHTAVSYVLGDPDLFLITAGDARLLPRILQAAARPQSHPTPEAMERLVADYEMSEIFRGSETL
jgi:aryl-alcohol dehydrogenase-like predicted oxidoreductase